MDDLPCLGVHVVAVQLVGQGVVRRASEHVQVAVECHHGVAVPPLRRRRRASEQVLSGNASPSAREEPINDTEIRWLCEQVGHEQHVTRTEKPCGTYRQYPSEIFLRFFTIWHRETSHSHVTFELKLEEVVGDLGSTLS